MRRLGHRCRRRCDRRGRCRRRRARRARRARTTAARPRRPLPSRPRRQLRNRVRATPPATGHPTSDPVPDPHVPRRRRPTGRALPTPSSTSPARPSPARSAGSPEHGFHAVTLHDVLLHWQLRQRTCPTHPVVISVRRRLPQPVRDRSTDPREPRLGRRDRSRRCGTRRDFWGLSETQVRLLIADGWEVAAHSPTHPDLTQLDDG